MGLPEANAQESENVRECLETNEATSKKGTPTPGENSLLNKTEDTPEAAAPDRVVSNAPSSSNKEADAKEETEGEQGQYCGGGETVAQPTVGKIDAQNRDNNIEGACAEEERGAEQEKSSEKNGGGNLEGETEEEGRTSVADENQAEQNRQKEQLAAGEESETKENNESANSQEGETQKKKTVRQKTEREDNAQIPLPKNDKREEEEMSGSSSSSDSSSPLSGNKGTTPGENNKRVHENSSSPSDSSSSLFEIKGTAAKK